MARSPKRAAGGSDGELLETGQEEVFSRTEIERGVTEHATEAGRHSAGGGQRDPPIVPPRNQLGHDRFHTREQLSEGTMTEHYDFETPGAMNGASRSALRDAALEARSQAGVLMDQAAAKAKAVYRQMRDVAGQRAGEAREAIVARPWAAIGAIFLAGLMIGHALSAHRAQVVYLKDRR
jgi:ElaB/YqjD/DUF883 family membrane-anchored ribosome-binding protein